MQQPLQIANVLGFVRLDANATIPTMLSEHRTHFRESSLRSDMDNRRILFAAKLRGFFRSKVIYVTVRVDTAAHDSDISDSIAHGGIISVIAAFSYAKRSSLAARS
jgi:hypothetical protein